MRLTKGRLQCHHIQARTQSQQFQRIDHVHALRRHIVKPRLALTGMRVMDVDGRAPKTVLTGLEHL